ncbi:DNA alkylation repair protein [Salipiger sp. 1_MG-2023]|uniref:DNA alkylation repair protein n=1 Tax=Salipiger sp. 1_MG-2023 TaxID=3062665 RepID=UPI0026E420CA|nr:DNA alkylation repair protein [Salipiger sp. 1_MG-2023]MDO6587561.1 DNA alkylation repair protein [Salipiger sp. 1_MG-2023]
MARGPDGAGARSGYSLADQLFNPASAADLAACFAPLPGFDAQRFLDAALPRFAGQGIHARLGILADALEQQLPQDFPAMAEALLACLPSPLDPSRRDDDFGRFIHAVFGVLAARRGLEQPEIGLDVIHAATQRFTMEYAIRPFLNAHPDLVMTRLAHWAEDDNYHVRRLVSEGTRPRLPWGMGLTLDPLRPLALLDRLQGDPTRFVTRSVANHLNDLSKTHPDAVLDRLRAWQSGPQTATERDWMARHALRTAVKRGEPGALALLGYRFDAAFDVRLTLPAQVRIGEALVIEARIDGPKGTPVLVDYRLRFHRPGGSAEKVFKLKTARLGGEPLLLKKAHRMKGDATTFRLHPGPHAVILQLNGRDVAEAGFDLTG